MKWRTMITKHDIIDAYAFLRTNNNSISDEVLDFIKDASLKELDIQERWREHQGNFSCPECGHQLLFDSRGAKCSNLYCEFSSKSLGEQ